MTLQVVEEVDGVTVRESLNDLVPGLIKVRTKPCDWLVGDCVVVA